MICLRNGNLVSNSKSYSIFEIPFDSPLSPSHFPFLEGSSVMTWVCRGYAYSAYSSF